MDSKNMKELDLEEMDKVSGGNGLCRNGSERRCPCGSTKVEVIFWWADGRKIIKCKECFRETTLKDNLD